MPLLDHFRPPLSRRRHWENLHSAWANALRDQLNDVLPPHYFAEVQISLGKQIEVDVGTFEEGQVAEGSAGGGNIAVWAPTSTLRSVLLPASPPEVFEVQVLTDEEGPKLVGAVELISPANKDRPAHRRQFAIKCASYLYQSVGLVMVDVVTHRTSNLHRRLLELIYAKDEAASATISNLYGSAYRMVPTTEGLRLDYTIEPAAVGEPLPTLPLWLGNELCIPLHLEPAYQTACSSSRIA